MDLPVWQELQDELGNSNFTVVSVAVEGKGPEAARPWIEAAQPSYPVLIDSDHRVPELYNTRNVPAIFWIDEGGRIVRGNDPAYLQRRNPQTGTTTRNEAYLAGVRDWVANGAASRYVTDSAETQRRIGEPDAGEAQALAEFRLALYLQRAGHTDAAIAHFKQAHALKPDNWNYKRQAWNLGDAERDYNTTVLEAVRGPIPFYPPLQLPDPT